MKHIYAIRDRIADELVGRAMYCLMCFRTNEEAIRYFNDAISDDSSVLNTHPADYELLHVGTIDDGGLISPDTPPQLTITGDTLLALQKPERVKEA